jgi:hypothetical protein
MTIPKMCNGAARQRAHAQNVTGANLGPLSEGERAREARAAHPLLTLSHPAREVGVLKQHGVGNGESELRADFASF